MKKIIVNSNNFQSDTVTDFGNGRYKTENSHWSASFTRNTEKINTSDPYNYPESYCKSRLDKIKSKLFNS